MMYFHLSRAEAAEYDALSDALEAEAERVETFERMNTRTDRPGLWPSLFETEGD